MKLILLGMFDRDLDLVADEELKKTVGENATTVLGHRGVVHPDRIRETRRLYYTPAIVNMPQANETTIGPPVRMSHSGISPPYQPN